MKNLITIAITFIALFGLSGCASKNSVANSISKETLENNSKIKVYYEDTNIQLLKESLDNMVSDLNSNEIIPPYIYTIVNPSDPKKQYKYTRVANSESKKINGMKFRLSPDKNRIIYDKNYNNMIEAYEEAETLNSYFVQLLENKDNKNRYRTSKIKFIASSLDLKGAAITTEFSSIYNPLAPLIKKQIVSGGWQMVDKKEDADKEIYFELSRDYYSKELSELKKDKKGIEFSLLKADNNSNIPNENYNNSNHIVVGQSAMSAASNSNSDLTSAAIGLGVSAIFSIFGNSSSKKEESGSFASLRVIDKINKTDNIKVYDTFIDSHKPELYQNISETINIVPDSKKYNIN